MCLKCVCPVFQMIQSPQGQILQTSTGQQIIVQTLSQPQTANAPQTVQVRILAISMISSRNLSVR